MADLPNPPPVGPDGVRNAGMSWRRAGGSQFEWISPAPSPVVVAELERLYPDIVQVPAPALAEEVDRWLNHAIVARCLSRWIPPEAILREFQRAGIQGEIESVSLANRHFLFRFSDPLAMELVLRRPWVANGQPIAVAPWQPDFVPSSSSLTSALLWIRLPQLPIEYWKEDVLSSIVAVAGDYMFSDASTRERIRGGFARVCLRVDLSLPLRPGARVRGSREPFWQQFSYENLEGICCSCGTLHLGGSCGAPLDPSSSSAPPSGSGFGPWMSSLRRRKSPPAAQPSLSNQKPGMSSSSPPSSASPDGWVSPKKFFRRSGGKEPTPPSDRQPLHGIVAADGLRTSACRFSPGVPVCKGSLGQASDSNIQSSEGKRGGVPIKLAANPFSCLESASSDGNGPGLLLSHIGGNSGPAKRARPVEPLIQRLPSKPKSSKGKGLLRGKDGKKAIFSFSAPSSSPQGLGVSPGPGSKKSRCKEGTTLGSLVESSLPPSTAVIDHDSAVSLLKNAIQQKDADMAMDSARQVCQEEGGSSAPELVGSHATSDSVVLEISGDMDDIPPAHPSE